MTEGNLPPTPRKLPAGYSSLSDHVDASLWPDLPQVDNDNLEGMVFGIEAVRELTGDKTKGPFFICKCLMLEGEVPAVLGDGPTTVGTGEYFTSAFGGTVVPGKIRTVIEKNGFPVAVRLIKVMSGAYASRGYFDLIGPDEPLPQKAQRDGATVANSRRK